MELITYAPIWGQSGFERLSRGLFLALDQIGVAVELRTANEWNQERVGLPINTLKRLQRLCQTRVSDLAPHVIYQLPRGQMIAPKAPVVCYTLFETDRCPGPWRESLMRMDKIFVFSEFNRIGWIKSGIPSDKIVALPKAVDSFLYNPDGPLFEIKNKKGFVFLTSGDFTERKNFDALLEAYVKEFTSSDLVTLIVKCHYAGFTKQYRQDCATRLREIVHRFNPTNPPRVLFYGDKVSDYAMAALYRSADCFVLTSRGEGYGMQYLEAMASSLPVIACDWSAHADYLNSTNSYPVAYNLEYINDPNYLAKCIQALNSKWAQVNVEHLMATMRHVVNNYSEAEEKAAKALEWVRQQTWQNMAVAFIKEIVTMFAPTNIKEKEMETVNV